MAREGQGSVVFLSIVPQDHDQKIKNAHKIRMHLPATSILHMIDDSATREGLAGCSTTARASLTVPSRRRGRCRWVLSGECVDRVGVRVRVRRLAPGTRCRRKRPAAPRARAGRRRRSRARWRRAPPRRPPRRAARSRRRARPGPSARVPPRERNETKESDAKPEETRRKRSRRPKARPSQGLRGLLVTRSLRRSLRARQPEGHHPDPDAPTSKPEKRYRSTVLAPLGATSAP